MPPVTEIRHRSHSKCMLKLESSSKPYICDGCQELGFGMCYRCRKCKFYIHKECAIFPPSSTYHHLFEGCKFEFYWNSPVSEYTVCDACGRDIKGSVYHCSKKRFDMHPQCAKLPLTLFGKDVKLELEKKTSLQCQKCRIKSSSKGGPKGWSYVSTCGRYCLHVACVKEMIYEAWEKSYFSEQGHDIYKSNLTLPSTIPSTSKGRRGRSSSRVRSPGTNGSSLSCRRDHSTNIDKRHRERSSSRVRSRDRGKSIEKRHGGKSSLRVRSRDRDISIEKIYGGKSSSRVRSRDRGKSIENRYGGRRVRSRDRDKSIEKIYGGRSSSRVRFRDRGKSIENRYGGRRVRSRDRDRSIEKIYGGRSSSRVRSRNRGKSIENRYGGRRVRSRDRDRSIEKIYGGRSSLRVRSRDRGKSIENRYGGRSSSRVQSWNRNKSIENRYRVRSRDRGKSIENKYRGRSSSHVRSRYCGKSIEKRHRGRSSSCVQSPCTHGSSSSSRTRRSPLKGRVPNTTNNEIVINRERKPSTKWKIARSVILIIFSAIFGEPITFSTSLISLLDSAMSLFTS